LEEAAGHFRGGDFDQALAVLREAAKKHPDFPPAQIIMAQFFASAAQPGNMRSALEQAVAEAPDDAEAYAVLGQLALQDRRTTEAGLLYARVLELVSSRKERAKRDESARRQALGALAMIADTRKDWTTAQKHLETLLADDPKNTAVLQQLGRVVFQQKKYDEAKKLFEEAARADENSLGAEASMARLYQQAGDSGTASKLMLAAINANPTDFKTRLVAAQWSLDIGKLDQADMQAQAAVKLNPQSSDAKFLRATIALFRKDYKTAQEMFEQAHLQSPGNFAATNGLAVALVEQDDDAKKRMALEYAQINARIGPDRPEANSTLGWVLYRLGRLDEAENALRKSASAGLTSPETAYYFARVAFERGRKDDARRLVGEALKSSTPFPMRDDAEALAAELKK
jgi:tetratricopeptide (TPR) repeat protein